tara:strand:- start:312 stop:3089 length:2778 start_codon:yes stop_codon:yes gene_type:complete
MRYISLITFFLSAVCFGYEIKSINLSCPSNSNCEFLEKRIELAIKSSNTPDDITSNLKFMIYDPLISSFSFEYELIDNVVSFSANAKLSTLVSKVRLKGTDLNLKTHFGKYGIREGEKFSAPSALYSVKELKNQLSREGFFAAKVWYKRVIIKEKLFVDFHVSLGEPTMIEKVKIKSPSFIITKKFKELEGKNWSLSTINLLKQESIQQLNDLGFYNCDIEESIIFNKENEKKAVLEVRINAGVKQVFHLEGNNIVTRKELLDHIKTGVARLGSKVTETQLNSLVQSFYQTKGILGGDIKTSMREGVDSNGQTVLSFQLIITEGDYKLISGFELNNLSPESNKLISSILSEVNKPYFNSGKFNKNEIELVRTYVVEKLKKLGYLDPRVSYKLTGKLGNEKVKLEVDLGDRFLIGKVSLGFDLETIRPRVPFALKRGDIFSESIADYERKSLIKSLKQRGYFFAKWDSSKPFIKENIITKKVDVDFQISPGLISRLNEVRIEGLQKTKKLVVFREIKAQKGDTLTPGLIQNLNDQLVSLNIFSFLSISPVVVGVENNENQVDLVINVREKDFGVLSISPGFRTDIGPKIDLSVQKNNISGENKNFLLGSRISKRTDLTLLDPQRRDFSSTFFEYRLNTSYALPYLFKSFNRTIFSSELTRRRFFGFDADIVRASASLDKKLSTKGSVFFRYQFELIKQFNATEDLENGEFRIGGITASYFFDNRNRVINPSKGSYHSLSAELAHPLFLSMNNDLEINFLKIQSRNRFYKRFDSFIFASSLAAGWQKNLGQGSADGDNKSYIPRVKVFRLEGVDNVRGYNSTEVNRVLGGNDISEYVIDDEASFFNLKAELRREVSTSVMLSTFYDLGKVMPEMLNFNNLNHSVGLSLKLLTPVGTLNLDYGLKLNREFVNGEKEQFGRFHLMVGYF